MQDIFNFFNQGWVGSIIGLIGIVLGALGIFSYRISRSIAKPSFQRSSLRLIGREEDNLPKEVVVTFKGKQVERLTRTTLVFWNNGTEVLDGKNVVETDPVKLSFSEGDRILSSKLIKYTKDANNLSIMKSESECSLEIKFGYLDPNDGLVIEVLHDSQERYPIISGSIKGIPKGFVDLGRIVQNRPFKIKGPLGLLLNKSKLMFGVVILLGLLITTYGLLPDSVREIISGYRSSGSEPITEQRLFFIIFGLLYASIPAYVLWTRRKRYPKELEYQETDG